MIFGMFFIVVIVWLILRWQRRKIFALSRKLPNNLSVLPIFGHLHHFLKNSEGQMNSIKEVGLDALRHGGRSSFWLGPRLYTVLADPEDVETALNTCLEKDISMHMFKVLIGDGTIVATVPVWRQRRRFLLPALYLKRVVQFSSMFARASEILVQKLQNEAEGATFSLWQYASNYTMDYMSAINYGISSKEQTNDKRAFQEAVHEICYLASANLFKPWMWLDPTRRLMPAYASVVKHKQFMTDMILKIIKKERLARNQALKKNEFEEGYEDGETKTALKVLIETSDGALTDEDLFDELLVLTIAGIDTSALSLSYASLMLARHPHIQEKLYEELQNVLNNSSRLVTMEDLCRMEYLDAVVKETLRLFPPVPMIVRTPDKEVILPSRVRLVPGIGVVLHIWAINRNPKYWGEDADLFKPERFIHNSPRPRPTFLTFSYGPRKCPGYHFAAISVKMALVSMLRKYRILPPRFGEKTETVYLHKDQPIRTNYCITQKDVDNFKIRLELRKKN